MPPLVIRAAAAREPAPDLRQPAFDAAITPLLLFAEWLENFSHSFGNSVSWVHARLQPHPDLASRVALVLATPFGLPLPPHWQALAGPLVPARPIQSYADFSARCAGSSRGAGAAGANHSRCYEELLVCRGSRQQDAVNISQASCRALRTPLAEAQPSGQLGTGLHVHAALPARLFQRAQHHTLQLRLFCPRLPAGCPGAGQPVLPAAAIGRGV